MRDYTEVALEYHRAGLHVTPVNENKVATCPWGDYMASQTEDDIRKIFKKPCFGIALIAGAGGVEVIDIDTKYDLTGRLMVDYMKEAETYGPDAVAFVNLVVQRTKSGGYHLIYRCSKVGNNEKLAMRPATPEEMYQANKTRQRKISDPNLDPKVLIETRGTGGYAVIFPTPDYEIEYGGLHDIPEITPTQRAGLHNSARYFNEIIEENKYERKARTQPESNPSGKTSWDDYNEKTDIVDLLMSYGWSYVYERGARVYLKRPGDSPHPTSGNYHRQHNLFVPHTSSTSFEAQKGYTAAAIYTVMEHGGDFSAAAKALYALGYGDRITSTKGPEEPARKEDSPDTLLEQVRATRYDNTAKIVKEKATLSTTHSGSTWEIGGPGMLGVIVGAQKAGKSLISSCITASGLSQTRQLTFDLDLLGSGVVYFDTEQSDYFYKKTQRRIHDMAAISGNHPMYEAYHLRKWSSSQRRKAINSMLSGRKDLSFIVIDGVVDLIKDFNSVIDSSEVLEDLMRWSEETGALILTVLHLTKADGFMRGHLGTALQNKCDFSIEVKKNNDDSIFRVKSRDSRFMPFPGFEFERDKYGNPKLIGEPEPKQSSFYDDDDFWGKGFEDVSMPVATPSADDF